MWVRNAAKVASRRPEIGRPLFALTLTTYSAWDAARLARSAEGFVASWDGSRDHDGSACYSNRRSQDINRAPKMVRPPVAREASTCKERNRSVPGRRISPGTLCLLENHRSGQ
jgi:hypothetical protein